MSKPIVDIRNLNLVFHVSYHRSWNIRDAFTKFTKDPFEVLNREKDRIYVARNLNLKIHEGERLGLLGVNGVGKTSLCRCIAGMYRPSGGDVELTGQVRAIFSTQVGIQPELTGRENARLIAQFMYPTESFIEELVDEAIEFSELGKFSDVPYRTYSNGMQARLCLSLISAKPAEILILDEVFDGADTFFKEKISKRVLDMIQESGAVIFVSHSPDQIKEVCNRVVVLEHGQIAYDGDPESALSFYNQRSTRFGKNVKR